MNITWFVLEKNKPEDEFYSSLSQNENKYKEYKNATLNIRKKINGIELKQVEKELGKYSFGALSADYPQHEVYFFASIYEDDHMIVKKYAIYDLDGKLLNSGIHRAAKKEAVLNGEFNGWENPSGENELSDKIQSISNSFLR